MTEESFLKIISTPGAVIVLMLWLHHRIAHVERCLECIANMNGVTLPKRSTNWKKSMLPVLAVLLTCIGVGCANVRQVAIKQDGSRVESNVIALWPATSALNKGSVKQTTTTQGVGTEGAMSEGGGTNLVSGLTELRRIMELMRP
jgi:hypothetical protein